ncbi:MAG: hypothetical protein IJJ20_08215 [Thermoguttaceae bacterium]|nr:hypothetical protein [Thermoguttaceae bacterium]
MSVVIEALDNIACESAPLADSHLANKAYVDAAVANGAGTASVSGDSVVSIPAHSLISCGLAPTEDSHLVNKAYVDAAVAAAGTATPIEEPAALGRVVVVDTLSDAADHTGTSLRDAIEAVTTNSSVVIKFSVSGTITLEQGEIVIPVGNISIDGEDKLTISGGGVSRVFALTNAYAILSLHRLTITGGNGVGATNSLTYGGAILMTANSALAARGVTFSGNSISGTAATVGGGAVGVTVGRAYFADCVFNNNSVETTGNVGHGGAIYVSAAAVHLHCQRCTFTANTASSATTSGGGAVTIINGLFENCVFTENSLVGGTNRLGGAVLVGGGIGTFQGCTFTGNNAGTVSSDCKGGAFYANTSYYVRIADCTFEQNTAYYGGGIVANGYNARQYFGRIERCVFNDNIVASSGRGVAIYAYYQSLTIEDCEFKNHAVGSSSGIIYVYGYTGKLFVVTINRCKFTWNSSSAATTGLVYCANLAQVYLYNTVFTANSFTATSGNHKCVYTTGSSNAFIYNCTFTNNTNKGGAFYAASGGVDIYNSVEYGNGSASGKGTNATVNAAKFLSDQSASVGRDIAYDSTKPLFAADGFTPAASSQVIDAGNNTYAVTAYDLVGKERVSGTKVDLGAVEYQGA